MGIEVRKVDREDHREASKRATGHRKQVPATAPVGLAMAARAALMLCHRNLELLLLHVGRDELLRARARTRHPSPRRE
jgi:hypothetical protein